MENPPYQSEGTIFEENGITTHLSDEAVAALKSVFPGIKNPITFEFPNEPVEVTLCGGTLIKGEDTSYFLISSLDRKFYAIPWFAPLPPLKAGDKFRLIPHFEPLKRELKKNERGFGKNHDQSVEYEIRPIK